MIATPITAQPPNEVWVDDGFDESTDGWGVTHFKFIQDGIEAVAVGGTIHVAVGIYNESITITKPLTLLGAQAGVDPTVETRNPGDPTTESIIDATGEWVMKIESVTGVTVDGFTIKGVDIEVGDAFGILLNSVEGCYIRNNIITDIKSTNNDSRGIQLWQSNNNEFRGNDILGLWQETAADYYGSYGVLLGDSQNNQFYNTNIHDIDTSGEPIGVFLLAYNEGNSGNTFENTTMNNIQGLYAHGVNLFDYRLINPAYTGINQNNSFTNLTISNITGTATQNDHVVGIRMSGGANNTFDLVHISNIQSEGSYAHGVDVRGCTGVEITQATITGTEIGVYVKDLVKADEPWWAGDFYATGNRIRFSNIYGNAQFGVLNEAEEAVDATLNYWGHPSGPSGVGPGLGDCVGSHVIYCPWITKPFETVLDKQIGYYGFPISLKKGWNTFSTPIELENSSWENISFYLDCSIALWFDASTQTWQQITLDSGFKLKPLGAVCVLMNSDDAAPLMISGALSSPPTKPLYSGWNLIGPAPAFGTESMLMNSVLTSVEFTPAGLMGYTVVVSPPLGYQDSWVYTRGAAGEYHMSHGRGYWVYMENPDILAGFSTTPVSVIL